MLVYRAKRNFAIIMECGEYGLDKTLAKKIIITVAAFLVLAYLAYLFYGANFSMVETETAIMQETADSIYSTGYVIRNETLIKNDSEGVVAYAFDDGGKVAAGGVVATVYRTEDDATAHKEIAQIDNQIDQLKKINMAAHTMSTGLDSINNQMNQKVVDLLQNINEGQLYDLKDTSEDLLYLINERMVVTGEVVNYNEKIEQLQAQKEEIQASCGEAVAQITSPVAGYFVSYTDGYEDAYDYTKAAEIGLDSLNAMLEKEPEKVAGNVIGKVISELNWFIACPITAQDSIELSSIYDDVSVNMPYATTGSVPVKIASVNQENKTSDAALVLECNYMSPELASLRNETVKIDIKTYTGIRVSKKSLHDDTVVKTIENEDGTTTSEEKKVQGVYVVYGNELIFKQVSILYAGEDFVLCDPQPEEGVLFNGTTVELYDKIVTEGADLYAGKIVKQ